MTDLLEIATVALSAFSAFASLCLLRRWPAPKSVATVAPHVPGDALTAVEPVPAVTLPAPGSMASSAHALTTPMSGTSRYRIVVLDPETGAALPDAFPLEGEDGDSDHAIAAAWESVLSGSKGVGDFQLIDARYRTPRARHIRRAS